MSCLFLSIEQAAHEGFKSNEMRHKKFSLTKKECWTNWNRLLFRMCVHMWKKVKVELTFWSEWPSHLRRGATNKTQKTPLVARPTERKVLHLHLRGLYPCCFLECTSQNTDVVYWRCFLWVCTFCVLHCFDKNHEPLPRLPEKQMQFFLAAWGTVRCYIWAESNEPFFSMSLVCIHVVVHGSSFVCLFSIVCSRPNRCSQDVWVLAPSRNHPRKSLVIQMFNFIYFLDVS